ncbi:MAG: RagB/SusD family nutrient uptake outer membrane protein [Tannerellaceae bacterium]|nr:RagB/SusD family nutrient uptake outer membrane protein [Tannerellaceae bacterium]
MKTNILQKLWVLPALLLLFSACNESKFLDLVNPNRPTEFDFWKDEADVQSAMATVYSPIRSQMYGYYGAFNGFHIQNGRADDIWTVNDDADMWAIVNFFNDSNNEHSETIFSRLYRTIQRANILIENIEDVPMSDDKKNELIAEATFLRGFAYKKLVINFGPVPLRIKYTDTAEDALTDSASEEEVWAQIEANFELAKKYLPVERPASEAGRVTKGTAIAYLGKTYIFQNKFEAGEAELKTIMQAPYTYDLVADYTDNFTESKELNQESIFEIIYTGEFGTDGVWGSEESTSTMGSALPQFFGVDKTGGWHKVFPSASIVDEFTKELRPTGSDTKFDKRMYASFFFKYSDYNDVKADDMFFGTNYTFDDLWDLSAGKRAGGDPGFSAIDGVEGRFLTKKYNNWWIDDPMGNSPDNLAHRGCNYRIMRFAEVLLLHAEACAHLGKIAEATNDLNRIRERAGLDTKTWASKEEILEEMEHQKLLELNFEGCRFYDLKRWYSYDQMKSILTANKKQGIEYFQPKHFYLPIPQAEINSNHMINQHPLWQ